MSVMRSSVPSILLIDDDLELSSLLSAYFNNEGYEVCVAHDGKLGVTMMQQAKYDIVLLDVMLPELNGFEVLKEIRRHFLTPVIMLTAKDDEFDRVLGLEIGADDYIAKPFSSRELLARIRAHIRRCNYASPTKLQSKITAGGIEVDTSARKATCNQEAMDLTDAEFALLELLAINMGKAVSKDVISEHVFNRKLSAFDRSIDMHCSNLRKKLRVCNAPSAIQTIRGNGYMLMKNC